MAGVSDGFHAQRCVPLVAVNPFRDHNSLNCLPSYPTPTAANLFARVIRGGIRPIVFLDFAREPERQGVRQVMHIERKLLCVPSRCWVWTGALGMPLPVGADGRRFGASERAIARRGTGRSGAAVRARLRGRTLTGPQTYSGWYPGEVVGRMRCCGILFAAGVSLYYNSFDWNGATTTEVKIKKRKSMLKLREMISAVWQADFSEIRHELFFSKCNDAVEKTGWKGT